VFIEPIVSQSLFDNPINKIMSMEQIFQDINKQMLETTYTLKLGQLLKIGLDLKEYMWQKLKLEKPNIAIKQILKPSVPTVFETHSELYTSIIKVNNHMAIIQVQVGKNLVENVLIDGGASRNIITENFITKLGLPRASPTPYHLRMVDQSMTRPLGIIKILKIHIHGIPYITTFIALKNNVVARF
jgi:hypothetical protein